MTQSDDFANQAFAWWPFLPTLKMLSFFEYELVFEAVFCTEQLECVVETFLPCFYAFLIFDPKWRFCKVYNLCLLAIFGNFQNALIFRILANFWSRFLHTRSALCFRNVFSMFYAFSVLDRKWGFWNSLCLVAIFGNFQNALIFRILGVFL